VKKEIFCFYYLVRNSLVALLEALCARKDRDTEIQRHGAIYRESERVTDRKGARETQTKRHGERKKERERERD